MYFYPELTNLDLVFRAKGWVLGIEFQIKKKIENFKIKIAIFVIFFLK